MSSDDRLARLGLAKLKDDPKALEAALDEKIAAYEKKKAAWEKERAAKSKAKKAKK